LHALDADPAMLDRLRRKLADEPREAQACVRVTVGDMRVLFDKDSDELVIEAQAD
jgi:hypothetical protein